jgi:drug/metabolite transporter (DMT)-like permease
VVFNAIRLLGPTRVMTLQSLVPAMAVVLAFLFLHEAIRPIQVVGGAIIVLGVALTRFASRGPAEAAS